MGIKKLIRAGGFCLYSSEFYSPNDNLPKIIKKLIHADGFCLSSSEFYYIRHIM